MILRSRSTNPQQPTARRARHRSTQEGVERSGWLAIQRDDRRRRRLRARAGWMPRSRSTGEWAQLCVPAQEVCNEMVDGSWPRSPFTCVQLAPTGAQFTRSTSIHRVNSNRSSSDELREGAIQDGKLPTIDLPSSKTLAALPPVVIGHPGPSSPTGSSATAAVLTTARPLRKLQNAKQLSLLLPTTLNASDEGTLSPGSFDVSETRSLPPTPRLAVHASSNGPVLESPCDSTAVDTQARDRLTASLKGSMSMKRRTSLPRLNLAAASSVTAPTVARSSSTVDNVSACTSKSTTPLLVENLVARNREAGAPVAEDSIEAQEEFPYQYGPKEILPGLYLGSEQNAKDPCILKRYRISTVVCVAKEVVCPWTTESTCLEIEESAEEDGLSDDHNHQDGIEEAQSATTSLAIHDLSLPERYRDRPPSGLQESATSRPLLVRSFASTPNLKQRFCALQETTRPSNGCSREGTTRRSEKTASRVALSHTGFLHRRFPPNRLSGRPAISYTKLPWGHDEDDIAQHFATYQICELIDRARQNGQRCLVHCQLGVSRSATLMIGYCMRQAALGNEEALADVRTMHESYSFVRAKSRWIAPNIGLLVGHLPNLAAFELIISIAGPACAVRASAEHRICQAVYLAVQQLSILRWAALARGHRHSG